MKVGVFGGTFSPPHNGHVRTAKLFKQKIGLDKLYIVPAGTPPHKETDSWGTAHARLNMTCLAFSSFADISDFEICQSGKSYTCRTLEYLRGVHPKDNLYLLVGEDMFLSFDTWRNPDAVFSMATVVCMSRGDVCRQELEAAGADYQERYGASVLYLRDDPLVVSSTQIRKLCAAGRDISHLVPESVAKYIKENGLYKYE